jgi:hypothetical protein
MLPNNNIAPEMLRRLNSSELTLPRLAGRMGNKLSIGYFSTLCVSSVRPH